jgi:hypothetical protein
MLTMTVSDSDPAPPEGEACPAPGATYARIAGLPVRIERCELAPLTRDTTSGFTKVSTVVRLFGDGQEGQGEDITWDQIDQIEHLRRAGELSWLRGERTLHEVSTLLGLADLFPVAPVRESSRRYRRWAFESAALDLALRQNGRSLADALDRVARPVSFVVSIRLGDPATVAPLLALREVAGDVRFKLDPTPTWDRALLAELDAIGGVEVVDLKGRYSNATVAMDADPALYAVVLDGLPGAWIEDPSVTDETIELLHRNRDRITWDEPICCAEDIEAMPWTPRRLNLKPSRFGSLERLLGTYDYCEAHGIAAYGGGMFEIGPGRGQLQYLASLFHADGPNDLAPVEYNLASLGHDLPRSPLAPAPHATGFRWGSYDARASVRSPLPLDG